MPSSDRNAPSRDRPETEGVPRRSGAPRIDDGPIEPPQYIDPSEPWDPQSAEALTQLYESGEGYLHRRPEDEQARRRRPTQPEAPAAPSAGGEPANLDGAWLEARLAEMAGRLQRSLAEMNPDKAVEHLNRRLDAIEERFSEALGRIVQRSDLDGLKLIEAHVLELAAHIEQTRGRLDRIDAIDEQMQGLARQLEEGDLKRLDALEKQLQDYMAEWRRSDERTTSALHGLEAVVNRVGESIEAMEAQKPAPDLSLSLLGTPSLGDMAVESDPLSQVYADAARALEPTPPDRSSLDAADYMPKGEPAAELPLPEPPQEYSAPPAEQPETKPDGPSLPSPTFRALAMRAKLRQAHMLGAETEPGEEQRQPSPASAPKAAAPQSPRSIRSSLLLAGGITLFAAIGYLLVDIFITTSPVSGGPAEIKQGARPADAKAAPGHGALPRSNHADGWPPREELRQGPAIDGGGENAPVPPLKVARIEAIGSAMAAAFRNRRDAARASVEFTASIHKDPPAILDEAASRPMAMLPMTIGPASLRQAAMRGEPAAQLEVASRFAAGRGVDRDLQQAFHWYGRAAAQGWAVAQYRFGALYENGLGTSRDAERARVWYARAAEQGNIKAMHNLAVLSVSGGRSDYVAAAKWFTKAADHGLADSQINLAILYQNGAGVPKDPAQSYKWLTLAARGGDREAADRIPQIKARLSSAELRAADTMIAAWRPRTPEAAANETAAATTLDTSQ